jgi:hypothetical protein
MAESILIDLITYSSIFFIFSIKKHILELIEYKNGWRNQIKQKTWSGKGGIKERIQWERH